MGDTHQPPAGPARMPGPRRPQRANGRLRYERLLDAAEAVLGRDGPQGLTIQNLAREAGVPTASAYHFFSGPVAVSLALSERYLAGFLDLVGRPVDDLESLSWQQVVAILLDRAVAFYRAHPYAQTLVLGSDHSWHIRRADLANNREMAGAIAALIGPKLPPVAPDILHQTVFIGIGVGDAVLALSIAEQGCITDAYQREALVAICGYVTNRLLGDRPA